MNRFLAAALLAATVSVALPATASADMRESGALLDRGTHSRDHMLSVFGLVPWYDGFALGAGVRYTLPLIADGFIPPINDSFELEMGGDFAFHPGSGGYFWGAMPVVEARWTFHLLPVLAAYAKLGVGLQFDTYLGLDFWPHHNEAVGVLFKFAEGFALRGEIGYAGPRVGIGFAF